MSKIYNKVEMIVHRKLLRRNQTEAEAKIWQKIKNRNLLGFKFLRQFSIGFYVVDFYCTELRLVIEIDGDTHVSQDAKKYDELRMKYFESLNIKVIRFTNEEVLNNLDNVLDRLNLVCKTPPSLP